MGPLTYGRRRQLEFLGVSGEEERNYSEDTARLIDGEVRSLVEEAQQRARDILSVRRPLLDALAAALQEREVMDREEVERLVGEYTDHGHTDGSSDQRGAPAPEHSDQRAQPRDRRVTPDAESASSPAESHSG